MRTIIVLTTLMSTLCFGQSHKLNPLPKELQGTIPNFSVYTINTSKLDQDDFRSKAKKAGAKRIAFSFFQTTCVNCFVEFKLLGRNASELEKNGVQVYLIDVGEKIEKFGDKVSQMAKEYAGGSFPFYFDPLGNLLKKSGLVAQNGDFALPITIVMDSDLRVLGVLSAVSEEDYPQILWSEL